MASDTEPTSTPQPSRPVVPRSSRPVSEALLNDKVGLPHLEQKAHAANIRDALLPLLNNTPRIQPRLDANKESQWDHCLSSLLIRSGLGLGFGVIFSVLLFKRRAWPAWLGLGFGAGRAVEECDTVCCVAVDRDFGSLSTEFMIASERFC